MNVEDIKFIIKTTLLGGITGAILFRTLILIGLLLSEKAFLILTTPIWLLIDFMVERQLLNPDAGMIIFLLYRHGPGLIFGLIGGFLLSLFWNRVEHKRKENKMLSSLKYRTSSFFQYCLLLGESTLCVVVLFTPLLCILNLFFPLEAPLEAPYKAHVLITNKSTTLLVGFFMTIFSALIIWRCEVYIAEEKKFVASALLPEQEPNLIRGPFCAEITRLLGGILFIVLTTYLLFMVIVCILQILLLIIS